eukprot:gene21014-27876_t
MVLYELFTSSLLAVECLARAADRSDPMQIMQAYAKSCWQQNPGARADMTTVLEDLWKIQEEATNPTPGPLAVVDAIAWEVVDTAADQEDDVLVKQGCGCIIC